LYGKKTQWRFGITALHNIVRFGTTGRTVDTGTVSR
jgi:hypothetical protein